MVGEEGAAAQEKTAGIAPRRSQLNMFAAVQAPSEAGSILKPGPIVEDRLMRFT